jgi:membrane-associated phospholipid phosphatase
MTSTIFAIINILIFTASAFHSQILDDNKIESFDKLNYEDTCFAGNELKLNNLEVKPEFPVLFTVGSIAITAALLVTDENSYKMIRNAKNNSYVLQKASPIITQLGDGKFSLILFGGFGAYHFLAKDEKAGQTALLGIESFLLSGAAVQILKHTFGRERPSNSSENGGEWNGPFFTHKNQSIANFDAFPSGHTATIFATATTLSYIYPNGFVPYAAYGIASLVALSRVSESTHWLSDCFVGGMIGFLTTKYLYNLQNKKTDINVELVNQYNGYALQIIYAIN